MVRSPVGGSASVETSGKGRSQKMGTLLGGSGFAPFDRLVEVTLYCPDGSDPNISANTDTVYVGPNGTAAFPLGPGGTLTIVTSNPYAIGIACATDSQLVFLSWGDGVDDA